MKSDSQQRDLYPSKSHRTHPNHHYNFNMDIIEYDKHGMPVVCIEEKHSTMFNINDDNLLIIDLIEDFRHKCQINAANKMRLPYFVVQYWHLDKDMFVLQTNDRDKDGYGKPILKEIFHSNYYVVPGNEFAKTFMKDHKQLSKQDYVQLMAQVRFETIPNGSYNPNCFKVKPPTIRNY